MLKKIVFIISMLLVTSTECDLIWYHRLNNTGPIRFRYPVNSLVAYQLQSMLNMLEDSNIISAEKFARLTRIMKSMKSTIIKAPVNRQLGFAGNGRQRFYQRVMAQHSD